MKCKECKFMRPVGNTEDRGIALCTAPTSWRPISVEDDCCLFSSRELTCGDCLALSNDMACVGMYPEESTYNNGKLCSGFIDKKEEEFKQILLFWKTHDCYDRVKIERLINEFESFFEENKEKQ